MTEPLYNSREDLRKIVSAGKGAQLLLDFERSLHEKGTLYSQDSLCLNQLIELLQKLPKT